MTLSIKSQKQCYALSLRLVWSSCSSFLPCDLFNLHLLHTKGAHCSHSHISKHLAAHDIIITYDQAVWFWKKFSRDTQLIEAVLGMSQSIQLRTPQRFAHGVRYCIDSTVSNTSKRIKAVLSHRSQVVSVNGNWYQSSPKDVLFGVSHGSTLGPVLFLLFNNAMSIDSQSNLLLFDCVDFPL